MNRAKLSKLNTERGKGVAVYLSAASVARLALFSRVLGLANGKVIDLALANLETCEACEGTGHEAPNHDRAPEHTDPRCSACLGWKVLPKNP